MRVIYAPEGGARREWAFDPWELDWQAAAVLESMGDTQWSTFYGYVDQLVAGGIRAQAVTVWCLLARDDPSLRLDDVKMRAGDVVTALDDSENDLIREVMAQDPDVSPDALAAALQEMGSPMGPFGTADGSSPPEASTPDPSQAGATPTPAT